VGESGAEKEREREREREEEKRKGKERSVCDLLSEVAEALYYVGVEVRPPEVNYPRYEKLYYEVEDLKERIGCKR
jgi:hypothetical protein